MDFELSDDQLALKEAARALLDAEASPARVRKVVDDGSGLDPALWRSMAEQGWAALEVPEPEGGLGLGLVEVAVLCEEVGRHLAPAPFMESVVASFALRRAGVPRGAELAGLLAAGEAVACLAWSQDARSVRATGEGQSWELSGRADPVPFAPVADLALVFASEPSGDLALFCLELDPSARPPAEAAMDCTRCLAWLELDRAPATRLGGQEACEAVLDRAATCLSAEMLGAADRVLSMTVDYAKARVQFDRPIGSFQAVKHRCADMLVDVEGMRSAAYYAAWSVGAAQPDASLAASVAKAWCSDAARRVMASGLQVHGGIGFTWEHDLHLYLKRAQLDEVAFGDAAFHRDRLAGRLRARVEAGGSVL
jgi:alkylation response protein AidB-like acyl-CoA dehydrogenase